MVAPPPGVGWEMFTPPPLGSPVDSESGGDERGGGMESAPM